jgi:hypothetical protein
MDVEFDGSVMVLVSLSLRYSRCSFLLTLTRSLVRKCAYVGAERKEFRCRGQ